MSYNYEIKIWKSSKHNDDDDEKEMVYEFWGTGSRTVKTCLQSARRTLLDTLKKEE